MTTQTTDNTRTVDTDLMAVRTILTLGQHEQHDGDVSVRLKARPVPHNGLQVDGYETYQGDQRINYEPRSRWFARLPQPLLDAIHGWLRCTVDYAPLSTEPAEKRAREAAAKDRLRAEIEAYAATR